MTALLKKREKRANYLLHQKNIEEKIEIKIRKIRKLSQIIRKILAALLGPRYGALYYNELDKNKQHGLTQSNFNYEDYV